MSIDQIISNIVGGNIPSLDERRIHRLIFGALNNNKRRLTENIYPNDLAPIQELFSAILIGSYIRPHMHPKAEEAIVGLKGRFAVVTFSGSGSVTNVEFIEAGSDKTWVVVRREIYHTLLYIPRNERSSISGLVYNPTTGPYDSMSHSIYPTWAVPEGDVKEEGYYQQIVSEVKKFEKSPLQ